MRPKPIQLLAILVLGGVMGGGIVGLWQRTAGPSWGDHYFVQACGELNGRQFSLETIKTLKGYCAERCSKTGCISAAPCTEQHVRQYLNFVEFCGDVITGEAQNNRGIPGQEDNWHPAYRRLSDCVERFNANAVNWVGYNGMFVITQGGVDHNWQCRIESTKPFIKAVPFYNYE